MASRDNRPRPCVLRSQCCQCVGRAARASKTRPARRWFQHGSATAAGSFAQIAACSAPFFVFGRARGGAHRAPIIGGIDKEDKTALAVEQQVFVPAELLIVTRFPAHAVLKTHHLPVHAPKRPTLPRAMLGRTGSSCSAARTRRHALAQVDGLVHGAGAALRGVQLHSGAPHVGSRTGARVSLSAASSQAAHLQRLQAHHKPCSRCGGWLL